MVVNFVSHQDTFNVSCITVDNIGLHRLCLQPVNTVGLVPKRRAKYKHAATNPALKAIITDTRR